MPSPVFLRGHLVDLRLLDREEDFERCWAWISDPDVWKYLGVDHPTSRQEEEEFFTKPQSNSMNFAIVTKDGTHIGIIGLHRISQVHGTAVTGTLIGPKECWGRGFGTDAKMTLLGFAFFERNLRKVISYVLAFNERSANYARACGYELEAVFQEELFKNGRFVDLLRFAVYRPQFEQAWERYQARIRERTATPGFPGHDPD